MLRRGTGCAGFPLSKGGPAGWATTKKCVWKYWLFDSAEGLDLGFQRLVVLALDLKFGLEFLHEELQTRNFYAKPL